MCCDQTALNQAVWTERLAVHPLPAVCNWICHLAMPIFDPAANRFLEPCVPHHPIGMMHLTAETKDSCLETRDEEGNTRSISLGYERPRSKGPS